MKTEFKDPKNFLDQVKDVGLGEFVFIFLISFFLLGFSSSVTVFSGIPIPSRFLIFFAYVSAFGSIIFNLFLRNVLEWKRRVCILTATLKYSNRTELTEVFIWAENNGWPVIDTLKPVQYQFTLEVYHDHLRSMATEIATQMALLSPGEKYSALQERLRQIHNTESWAEMTKKANEPKSQSHEKEGSTLAVYPPR